MDLFELIPDNETTTVEIKVKGKLFTNEDGSPMTIEVFLPHSEKYQSASYDRMDATWDKERKEEVFKAEEMVDQEMEFLAKTTKGWNITVGGEQPKFSIRKAKEVYTKMKLFLPDLIREAQKDTVDFT